MAKHQQHFLLAVEAAVMGGSVAVFADSEMIDCWTGSGATSRAEDLLAAIDNICTRSIGGTARLNKIAVSVGPGSFTGLRIGIASVKGLSKGLGIKCVGVPVLEAMAHLVDSDRTAIAAIPMGRSDICYQQFDSDSSEKFEIRSISRERFERLVNDLSDVTLVVDESLSHLSYQPMENAGKCLAKLVGTFALADPSAGVISPIYVQNPRFT